MLSSMLAPSLMVDFSSTFLRQVCTDWLCFEKEKACFKKALCKKRLVSKRHCDNVSQLWWELGASHARIERGRTFNTILRSAPFQCIPVMRWLTFERYMQRVFTICLFISPDLDGNRGTGTKKEMCPERQGLRSSYEVHFFRNKTAGQFTRHKFRIWTGRCGTQS
jgi:hypothetical protein